MHLFDIKLFHTHVGFLISKLTILDVTFENYITKVNDKDLLKKEKKTKKVKGMHGFDVC